MPGRTADLVPERCALADVIQEAPHLMTLLQRKSRKALSGCNKQLRAMMHRCVTAITVHEQSDLAQIVKGDWPQLVMIVLGKHHDWDRSWPRMQLDFCWPYTHRAWELPWPRNGNVQLIASFWLGKLNMTCTAFLVSSVQKQLQAHAVVTAFPLLLSSKLADVDDVAIKQHCGTVAMPDLSLLEWSYLMSLYVVKSQLSCAAIGCLLRGCPVSLNRVDLSENDVRAAGIESLVAAHLPNLGHLWLGKTELDAAALQHLVTGKWPALQSLSLDGNQLDDMAVECLRNGDWPKLSSLCLHYNAFGALGVHYLSCGRWPLLDYLTLDFAAIDASVLALLSICCDDFPSDEFGRFTVPVTQQHLDHHPDQPLLWPKLEVVQFFTGLHDYVA